MSLLTSAWPSSLKLMVLCQEISTGTPKQLGEASGEQITLWSQLSRLQLLPPHCMCLGMCMCVIVCVCVYVCSGQRRGTWYFRAETSCQVLETWHIFCVQTPVIAGKMRTWVWGTKSNSKYVMRPRVYLIWVPSCQYSLPLPLWHELENTVSFFKDLFICLFIQRERARHRQR